MKPAVCLLIAILLLALGSPALAEDPPPAYGLSAEEIAAYPEPAVEALPVNEKRMYDRWYQQALDKLDIFDAPNGTVTASLDKGFNFVTALQAVDGWTEINPGQWVRSELLKETGYIVSSLTGVLLPADGLPYPMAWALVNMYPSRFPGGDPAESNGLIYRYTRLNLYATVELEGEIWYQVGVDQWVHQYHVAKIIPVERPAEVDTHLWFSLDLYEQVLVMYEDAQPVFSTLIATGLDRWPTREGLYNIYFRKERDNMSGGQVGDDFYFLEEVPWTMFFDEGRALHGAYWHDGFGYRRSHGCVNLSITDAHFLYQRVADEMGTRSSPDREHGPAVYIYSSGVYR